MLAKMMRARLSIKAATLLLPMTARSRLLIGGGNPARSWEGMCRPAGAGTINNAPASNRFPPEIDRGVARSLKSQGFQERGDVLDILLLGLQRQEAEIGLQ